MHTLLLALAATISQAEPAPFHSARYGVSIKLPADWSVLKRELDALAFAAAVPGTDGREGGVFVCELAIAPESLDDWRTRIAQQAQNGRLRGLVRNEIVNAREGPRLFTLVERAAGPDELWVEHTVRIVANRQLYSFKLIVDSRDYARAHHALELALQSLILTPPETGTLLIDPNANRWEQAEFKLAIDLPPDWRPALAPAEVALFYANGPAHGIWADNCLIVARPHAPETIADLQQSLPDRIRREEPGCVIERCERVPRGAGEAIETIVSTKRGPFEMTVIEHRIRGERFDYEIKFTLESARFEALLPELRKSLQSFQELPGNVRGVAKPA